jgi:hypothetical protein
LGEPLSLRWDGRGAGLRSTVFSFIFESKFWKKKYKLFVQITKRFHFSAPRIEIFKIRYNVDRFWEIISYFQNYYACTLIVMWVYFSFYTFWLVYFVFSFLAVFVLCTYAFVV